MVLGGGEGKKSQTEMGDGKGRKKIGEGELLLLSYREAPF